MFNIKSKGFTLIELIIVAAIIGLIATASILSLNPFNQFQKGSDAKRKSDLSQVQKALEAYYQDKGSYPASDSSYRIVSSGVPINWGASWQPYMNLLPKDPSASNKYAYYSSNGQSYYIYANLSRGGKDLQACHTDGSACSSLSGNSIPATACGGTCNFGVSSPNVSP